MESKQDGEMPKVLLYCSFCRFDKVRYLVHGPNHVYICEDCIQTCAAIVAEEVQRDANPLALTKPDTADPVEWR